MNGTCSSALADLFCLHLAGDCRKDMESDFHTVVIFITHLLGTILEDQRAHRLGNLLKHPRLGC